jgi:predicted nucleic acid-binding protein
MNVIVDTNVLVSALIKNSTTRRLIFESGKLFLFPSYIFQELEKHKQVILKKSSLSEEEFNILLNLILSKFFIVPDSILYPYRKKALEIMRRIDSDDMIFIACALAYPNSVIWSNDKKLKNQKKVKILNTKEIMKFL